MIFMLLKSMSMEEFRGIRRCDVPLRFSKFTVLIGRNNSGKSSILEAISLLPFPKKLHIVYGKMEATGLLEKLHGGRSSLVYGYYGRARITYIVDDVSLRVEIISDGGADVFVEDKRLLSKQDVANLLKMDVERVDGVVLFIPNDSDLIGRMLEMLRLEEWRSKIQKLGAHVRIVKDLINKCIDDKYTEVLVDSPELRLRKELLEGNYFYIKPKDLGDGVEKALVVSLWLEAIKPEIILWDDFEVSVHPSLIREMLKWLSSKEWQVIISTHSIDVLYRLMEIKPRDSSIILLRKGPDDILKHQEYSLEDVEDFLNASLDPRLLVDRLGL